MNTNDIYDNAIFACFIQPGDLVKELGLVISILLLDKSVLIFVITEDNENRVFDYPYDTLFELNT